MIGIELLNVIAKKAYKARMVRFFPELSETFESNEDVLII
jgi:hypothetical protein